PRPATVKRHESEQSSSAPGPHNHVPSYKQHSALLLRALYSLPPSSYSVYERAPSAAVFRQLIFRRLYILLHDRSIPSPATGATLQPLPHIPVPEPHHRALLGSTLMKSIFGFIVAPP